MADSENARAGINSVEKILFAHGPFFVRHQSNFNAPGPQMLPRIRHRGKLEIIGHDIIAALPVQPPRKPAHALGSRRHKRNAIGRHIPELTHALATAFPAVVNFIAALVRSTLESGKIGIYPSLTFEPRGFTPRTQMGHTFNTFKSIG